MIFEFIYNKFEFSVFRTTLPILQSVCQCLILLNELIFDRKSQKNSFESEIMTDKRAEIGRKLELRGKE
jgi:hypothetical protein